MRVPPARSTVPHSTRRRRRTLLHLARRSRRRRRALSGSCPARGCPQVSVDGARHRCVVRRDVPSGQTIIARYARCTPLMYMPTMALKVLSLHSACIICTPSLLHAGQTR